MAPKRIAYDLQAREALRRSVNILARAVKSTLGPRGKTVLIEKSYGSPIVTKDGVAVAKVIELRDKLENIGASLVRQAASKTSKDAGDGTTTATLLAEAIFEEALRNVASGSDPMSLRRGVEKGVKAVVEELGKLSTQVRGKKDIAFVGAIAANNDPEIGEQIADAMDKVGKDGVITVEEGQTLETTVELVGGMQFDRGYLSPYFLTDSRTRKCVLEDCYIFIHEEKLTSIRNLLPLLEKVVKSDRPLLVIAENVEREALATLVVNRLRGILKCCAVKAPDFGDRRKALLQDIAVLTGGQCITEDLGIKLDTLELDVMGKASRVEIDHDTTTIIGDAGSRENIQGRIKQIQTELDHTTSDYDREKLEERLAKLVGGVAVIKVGAATEIEMKEKQHRVEDSVHATRAAVQEGIVPGGGVALLRARRALDNVGAEGDESVGIDILRRALSKPLRQIVENAGLDGAIVLQNVLESSDDNYGYDAANEEYCHMLERGIVDPTKVVRTALQNGASIAVELMSTEAVVGNMTEKKKRKRRQSEEDYW